MVGHGKKSRSSLTAGCSFPRACAVLAVSGWVLSGWAGPGVAWAQPAAPEAAEAAGTSEASGAGEVSGASAGGEASEASAGGESTVIAGRYAREVFESTTAVNVVDAARLGRMQARTAGEALREQEGIWVQQTSSIGGAPIIRGLMGNQILLMVDGVRLNNVGLFAGPNSFLQSVDVEDVERIEVLRGAGSALYGTDALGGVVNLITKAPMEYTDGELKVGGLLKTTFGSIDLQQRVRAEALAADDRFRARLGVTAQSLGDLRGGGEIGLQHPSGWQELNYDGRLDWRLGPGQQLSFAAWHVGQTEMERFDNYTRGSATVGARDRNLYRLSYEHEAPGAAVARFTAVAWLHDQIGSDENLVNPERTSRSRYVTPGLDLQAHSALGEAGRLVYGLHYHRDFARSESKDAGVVLGREPDATWDNAAAFVSGEYDLLPWLTLEVAGRLDFYRFVTDPGALSAPEPLTPEDLRIDASHLAPTGALGLVARTAPWLNFVGKLGNAFRAPNLSDTVSSGPFTYGYSVPGAEVKPEQALTAELGARVQHTRVSAGLTGFYTWIDGLIASERGTFDGSDYVDVDGNGMRDPGEDVYVKRNVGDAWIAGVEANLEVRITPSWLAFGNASWITGGITPGGHDADGAALPDTPLPRAYPTNFTVGGRWQDGLAQRRYIELVTRVAFTLDADDIPEDRRLSDAAFRSNPQDNNSPLLNGDGSVPGYALVAVRAGAPLNDHLDLRLSVGNLFNAEYRDKDSRIDGAGLSAVGTLIGHF